MPEQRNDIAESPAPKPQYKPIDVELKAQVQPIIKEMGKAYEAMNKGEEGIAVATAKKISTDKGR